MTCFRLTRNVLLHTSLDFLFFLSCLNHIIIVVAVSLWFLYSQHFPIHTTWSYEWSFRGLVKFVWKKHQMTYPMSLFMRGCTAPEVESWDLVIQLISTIPVQVISDDSFPISKASSPKEPCWTWFMVYARWCVPSVCQFISLVLLWLESKNPEAALLFIIKGSACFFFFPGLLHLGPPYIPFQKPRFDSWHVASSTHLPLIAIDLSQMFYIK